MRWYYIGSTNGPADKAFDLIYCQQDLNVFLRDLIGSQPYEKATDLIYCQQDINVFLRDLIGTQPYEKANDLIYCQQDINVFLRDTLGTPPYEKAVDLIYCQQDLNVFNVTPPGPPAKYIKFEMNGILAEIQVEQGSGLFTFTNLTTYPTTGSNLAYQTPTLNAISDNYFSNDNSQYIGILPGATFCSITAGLPSANTITKIAIAPQSLGTSVFNAPSTLRVYDSTDGINYTLLSTINVGVGGNHSSPYTNTILRPGQLTTVSI